MPGRRSVFLKVRRCRRSWLEKKKKKGWTRWRRWTRGGWRTALYLAAKDSIQAHIGAEVTSTGWRYPLLWRREGYHQQVDHADEIARAKGEETWRRGKWLC